MGSTDDRFAAFAAMIAPESPELQALSLAERKAAYFYALGYERREVAELLGVRLKVVTKYASEARQRMTALAA